MLKHTILFLALTLFFVFLFRDILYAQNGVTLQPVVVTAERPGSQFQTGDVDQEHTPAFFSVLKREDFEGKMEDLSEVIEKESAIQIRRSGGVGSFSTMSLRGSSSDQVMVFMDGILLNDASGGGVDLSNISLSDVEAIEIYRGVTPINFGKASIGGVVNIRTLRSKKELTASATAGYGSFDTRKLAALIIHKPGKWDYLISADYLGSNNDFEFLNDNGTQLNPDDDMWETRNNAEVDQRNLLAKFGFDFTDDVRAVLLNQWFSNKQGLPSWNNMETTKTSFDTERNITTLKLIANDLGPYHVNTNTRIDYSWKEEEYDDSHGHVGLGQQHSVYTTNRYGANFFLEWLTEWNTASLMLDAQHEEYDPEDIFNSKNPNKSTRDTFSVGLQDSMFLFQDGLIVTPALRYTIIEDDLKSAMSTTGTPLEGMSRDKDYFSPQLGLKHCPLGWLALKANIAKYVREPSFFELFGDRGFFIPNEELKAEKGVNSDVGFEITWLTSNRWLKRVSFNAAYFRSNVDDFITRSYDARGIGRSENISDARIQGIASGINLDFLKHFRFVGNATWQDAENRSQIEVYDGKKLPGRFERSYLARIEANWGRFRVYCENIIEKGMYYDTVNLHKAEDRDEINAGISWLFSSLLLGLQAKNLGDDRYEDFQTHPLPGRSYYFTVKYGL
jgi:iron complex outermembrane receptor protein